MINIFDPLSPGWFINISLLTKLNQSNTTGNEKLGVDQVKYVLEDEKSKYGDSVGKIYKHVICCELIFKNNLRERGRRGVH